MTPEPVTTRGFAGSPAGPDLNQSQMKMSPGADRPDDEKKIATPAVFKQPDLNFKRSVVLQFRSLTVVVVVEEDLQRPGGV